MVIQNQPLSLGVGGLILNVQGQVLLVERCKQPDLWTLPSGYVEKYENLYQALQRELQEEAGITIQPFGVVGLRQRLTTPEGNNVWILIRAEHIRGAPVPDMKEISRVSFFDLHAVFSLRITPVTLHILTALQERSLRELPLKADMSQEGYIFFS